MRKARETTQGGQHRLPLQSHRLTQRERGQGIGNIVLPCNFQLCNREQWLARVREILFALLLNDAEIAAFLGPESEAGDFDCSRQQWPC